MSEFSGKKILVLGASSSIGLNLCDHLFEKGALLITQGNRNVSKINADYSPIFYEFSKTNINQFCKNIEDKKFDGIVVLLGKTDFTFFSNMSIEKWNDVLFTNLTLPAMLLSKLSKQLNESASLVLCSSLLAEIGEIGMSHYSAAKAGLLALTQSLAKEFSHKKIRVNAVVPHLIETENTANLSDKKKEMYIKKSLLNRIGQTKDVSSVIEFLLSEKSSYINGQSIRINGGTI